MEELIKSDPIWEVFPAAQTFESFKNNLLKPIFLKAENSVDVKESVLLAGKILEHSYFEYQFIDVALTYVIFAFEKALKIRCKEITGKDSNLRFVDLIDWFLTRGYFETWNDTVPHALRNIRNDKVHETANTLGGVAFINKVYDTIDLINDLYEDPALRAIRKREITSLSDALFSYIGNGAILTYNNKRFIIYRAYPVFINNKSATSVLNFSVCPIFNLTPYKDGKSITPGHIQLELENWSMTDEGFTAVDKTTSKVVGLKSIDDPINQGKFNQWLTELYAMPEWSVIEFMITEPLEKLFIFSHRGFHKIP